MSGSPRSSAERPPGITRVGTVHSLGVAVLKGAAHTHPSAIAIERDGVPGDRRWALVQARGSLWRVVRTVEFPAVMTVHARPDRRGGLWLDFPDGRSFLVPEPDGPGIVADYWGRTTELRPVSGPWDSAFSDLLGREVKLAAVARAGGVIYADPVSIVTTSSVRELARRAGVASLEDERFRSTIVVDTPRSSPFVEEQWVGGRLRVGSVELLVRRQLARCAVIRFAPGTGRAAGADLLRALATDRTTGAGVVFGVGATVLTPGTVAVGQTVEIRDPWVGYTGTTA